jgi:hypothetical protein
VPELFVLGSVDMVRHAYRYVWHSSSDFGNYPQRLYLELHMRHNCGQEKRSWLEGEEEGKREQEYVSFLQNLYRQVSLFLQMNIYCAQLSL